MYAYPERRAAAPGKDERGVAGAIGGGQGGNGGGGEGEGGRRRRRRRGVGAKRTTSVIRHCSNSKSGGEHSARGCNTQCRRAESVDGFENVNERLPPPGTYDGGKYKLRKKIAIRRVSGRDEPGYRIVSANTSRRSSKNVFTNENLNRTLKSLAKLNTYNNTYVTHP